MAVSLAQAGAPTALWGLHKECNSGGNDLNRSSVSFACRRSGIAGASVSLNLPNVAEAATSVIAHRLRLVRAVAAEKSVDTAEPASTAPASQKTEYHFLVANAQFMLDEEEHFQELMRERLRYFGEQSREQDFWLVIEPEFLANFPDITKRLGRPAVALVSTDSTWITFMKLRLDRVLKGAFEADTIAEALAGGNSSTEINFEKPGVWTAPYSKYEGPWWTPFLPPQ
ncbi:unnamed protein product [Calypogeia fissa]